MVQTMIGDFIIYMATLTTMVSVIASDLSRRAVEHVDCVEVNHFHDINGHQCYTQLIAWEWNEEESTHHVCSWKIIEANETLPTKQNSKWIARYHDRTEHLDRVLVTSYVKETWTQNDPERDDKETWPEAMRRRLIRRAIEPVKEESFISPRVCK